jgi:hypothetical protein
MDVAVLRRNKFDCSEILVHVQPALLAFGDVRHTFGQSIVLKRSYSEGALDQRSLLRQEILGPGGYPADVVAQVCTRFDHMGA